MRRITSRTNNEIKQVALLLLHDRKERRAQGLFVAEGLRTVTTLIQAEVRLKTLYVDEALGTTPLEQLMNTCRAHQIDPYHKVTRASISVLEKISDTANPSGIVGIFYIPFLHESKPLGDGIVLANITSPGNMGTIIRTAAALHKKTVVIVDGVDAWSPKVVQASAGTVGMVDIIECSWQELLVRKKDLPLVALVVTGGSEPKIVSENKKLFVVGNEAHGLPESWVADCEKKVTLPMPGNTESLNAALAASIVMYFDYMHY